MSREVLKSSDSMYDSIYKMSEGNPGAMQVVIQMMNSPDPKTLIMLLHLDSMGIRGSNIYMLWNDCCDRDLEFMLSVLDDKMRGKISEEDLWKHIRGDGVPRYSG